MSICFFHVHWNRDNTIVIKQKTEPPNFRTGRDIRKQHRNITVNKKIGWDFEEFLQDLPRLKIMIVLLLDLLIFLTLQHALSI